MACEVNQIFLGEVAAVQNYGAFVRIPGCKQQGLIHKSQISSNRVDDVADVLEKGERVWCKVISVQDDGKVGLSMKFVNQGNGKDLDPNGVQQQLDEQKKKKFNPREERKAIVLEAVYKTICSRCKTAGHLAKDCFSTPDGKKYDLIPEEDDKPTPHVVETLLPIKETEHKEKEKDHKEKEKKHKLKKSKKRKKSKSKHADSDSEKSDSPDEKCKKKKRKSREHKKKKKKKQQSSSSDSDSASDSDNEHEDKRHAKKCKYSKARQ